MTLSSSSLLTKVLLTGEQHTVEGLGPYKDGKPLRKHFSAVDNSSLFFLLYPLMKELSTVILWKVPLTLRSSTSLSATHLTKCSHFQLQILSLSWITVGFIITLRLWNTSSPGMYCFCLFMGFHLLIILYGLSLVTAAYNVNSCCHIHLTSILLNCSFQK